MKEMERRDKERRLGSEGGKVSVWKGLSEVLLEEVQQRNLVMFSRLWTPDAVSLVGINLQAVWFSCTDELRHQEVGVEKVHVLI